MYIHSNQLGTVMRCVQKKKKKCWKNNIVVLLIGHVLIQCSARQAALPKPSQHQKSASERVQTGASNAAQLSRTFVAVITENVQEVQSIKNLIWGKNACLVL